MVHLYKESAIIQNVPTDIPDGQPGEGKPSDHPIVRPNQGWTQHPILPDKWSPRKPGEWTQIKRGKSPSGFSMSHGKQLWTATVPQGWQTSLPN